MGKLALLDRKLALLDKTVVVGMSGGVDSSVAALLLRDQGYRVIGMFMKNWEEKDDSGVCTSARDAADAEKVCAKLGIPFVAVEFVKEYWDGVFARFVDEYRAGLTPNPDVLCNREIKFKAFLDKALDLGADYLATGHYCQAQGGRLIKGADPLKDQSYFLYAVSGQALARTLFPIGHLPKARVRELAREAGLATHDKRDSTGICFIGERDFREFLSRYVPARTGEIRTLAGEIVGAHPGSAFFTLGQRKGLGLGGEGAAFFVVAKDSARNIVYVERGKDHPALYADWLRADELAWVSGSAPELPLRARAKARYRQVDQECLVETAGDGAVRVTFDQPQRALTPGQAVVIYDGDVCLGGGTIREVGPTYFAQGRDFCRPVDDRREQASGRRR